MILNLRLFLIIASIVLFVIVAQNVVKNKLLVKYSLLWILLSLILIVLSVFPDISFLFSDLLGFEKTSNFIFLVIMAIIILICLSYSITLSNMNKKLIKIVQTLAIEEKESRNKNES